MNRYKVALLDDNKQQLILNDKYLQGLGVEVVTSSIDAKSFLSEVSNTKPDVILVDLNLGDSYMTGMEVAYELKIPVLFVSSNTPQYVKEMENLKREFSLCVDHLTKPFSELDFQKTINRFLREVQFFGNQNVVHLNFAKQKRTKIELDSIVYLVADKASGAESNNKQIYFRNRQSENLVDFSFSKMEEKGLMKSKFITIHKSFRVNKDHIKCHNKKTDMIEVDVLNNLGKLETKWLPVSENYRHILSPLKK